MLRSRTLTSRRAFCAALLFAALHAAAAATLETGLVEMREVAQTWPAEGVVEAVRQATLAAQVSGRIIEVRADAGMVVAKGQMLARIDEREAAQIVASGQAQVARAEADVANAQASLERTRQLVEKKFVSRAALDKAQADYDMARAQLAANRATAGQSVTARGYATIVAPFAGIIATRSVQQGDMAQPGLPLFTLYDPRGMRVLASVPQARISEVRAANAATIELPSLNRILKARSLTVLPSADARTHTTQVRLDIPEGVTGVYPGLFARALFAGQSTRRLMIPARAVVHRSEVAGAYVIGVKGEISFRQLRLGDAADAAGIEVLAGVQGGERVALDPVSALAQMKAGAN